jgi:hypothetical protein
VVLHHSIYEIKPCNSILPSVVLLSCFGFTCIINQIQQC